MGHGQGGGAGAPVPNVKCALRSDPSISLMAEDESRASSSSRHIQEEKEGEEEEEEGGERDMGWLQLGIGSYPSREVRVDHSMESSSQRGGLIELDLFSHKNHTAPTAPTFHVTNYQGPLPIPHTSSAASTSAIAAAMPLYMPHPRSSLSFRQPPADVAWGYRQASSSSTPYYSHPYMMGPPAAADAGPSSGVRVVDAPLRRQSGIWFVLQASQNQLSRETT